LPIFSAPAANKAAKPQGAAKPNGNVGTSSGSGNHPADAPNMTPPGKVKSRRITRRESISTPSITNALKGNSASGEYKKEATHKLRQVTEPEEQPFTAEQLVAAWKEFVLRVESPQLNAALSSREPSLGDSWMVNYMLDNETQRERLVLEVKPKLLGFLRRTLRNERIEVEFQIAEGDDALPRKPYSDSEKWQAMVEANPSLALFKKMFGLDFDS
jgi:hypothetical protein